MNLRFLQKKLKNKVAFQTLKILSHLCHLHHILQHFIHLLHEWVAGKASDALSFLLGCTSFCISWNSVGACGFCYSSFCSSYMLFIVTVGLALFISLLSKWGWIFIGRDRMMLKQTESLDSLKLSHFAMCRSILFISLLHQKQCVRPHGSCWGSYSFCCRIT